MPTPILFDTDIGSFADDPYALALALSSPSLDVRFVLTTSGDTQSRARVAALLASARGAMAWVAPFAEGPPPRSAPPPSLAAGASAQLGGRTLGVGVAGVLVLLRPPAGETEATSVTEAATTNTPE